MRKKNIVMVLLMAIVVWAGNFSSILAYAKDPAESTLEDTEDSYDDTGIVLYSGAETLPMGEYHIGSFTFTNNNLTPRKTMPNGASTWSLYVKFCKASSDAGIGQVKLTVQIRRTDGTVVASTTVKDNSGEYSGGDYYRRYASAILPTISVRPGEVYQIWVDASSVNPSQSNGNYRSIDILDIQSYIG